MVDRSKVMRSRVMASRVERYHTWPTLHRETVAEHTFGVLRIYREIFGFGDGHRDLDVIAEIIDHDLDELHTGDLPFPVKMRYPQLREALRGPTLDARDKLKIEDNGLDQDQKTRIKICDMLQMWQFGKIERRMGNLFALDIVTDCAAIAVEQAQKLSKNDQNAVMAWMQGDEL